MYEQWRNGAHGPTKDSGTPSGTKRDYIVNTILDINLIIIIIMERTSTHCHYFPLSPSPTIRNPESCRAGTKNYSIATLLACRRRSLPSTSRAILIYLVIIPQSRIIFFLVWWCRSRSRMKIKNYFNFIIIPIRIPTGTRLDKGL